MSRLTFVVMIDEVRVENRQGNGIKVLKPFRLCLIKAKGRRDDESFNLVSLE